MFPAKKILALVLTCVASLVLFLHYTPLTFSDELDDINKQLSELNDALNKSVSATKPLESQLTSMQKQVEGIKQHVTSIEVDLAEKKKAIDKGYENLAEKKLILNEAIRSYYIKSYYNTPLIVFLSTSAASDVSDILAYQRAKTNQDKALITNIALSITDLEKKKVKLESEQMRLLTVKSNLDEQSKKLDEVIAGAKAYQKELSNKIADLSAKQQEIINAKSGSFTASIGDSDEADDYNASIKGFRESAPAGSFAAFSFGAYTHRKGMSQYGAYGRVMQGKNYKDVLQAYYGKQPVSKDTGGTIKVEGFGEMDFEGRYLLGVAEMPSSWPMEALKAQAVASRTYAYRYKQQGSAICVVDGCPGQVYLASKADNPPAAWKQAVEATKGEVLEDVTTYFSSTTGGYLSTMGWDTTDGQGGANFSEKAYEKIAGTPWFYKAWYTKNYYNSSDKCGRSNPWLSTAEMADLINGAIVLANGNGEETGRITPVTTSCWGGNPYSVDELKSVSSKYGGGISSVSGVSVLQGDGSTNEVVFQTDKGEKRFGGSNFKTAFNLRAPGYISIPQSGFAFYNIEKK